MHVGRTEHDLKFIGRAVVQMVTVRSVVRNRRRRCSTVEGYRLVIEDSTDRVALHLSIANNLTVRNRGVIVILVRCTALNIHCACEIERSRLFDESGIKSAVAIHIVEDNKALALRRIDELLHSFMRRQRSLRNFAIVIRRNLHDFDLIGSGVSNPISLAAEIQNSRGDRAVCILDNVRPRGDVVCRIIGKRQHRNGVFRRADFTEGPADEFGKVICADDHIRRRRSIKRIVTVSLAQLRTCRLEIGIDNDAVSGNSQGCNFTCGVVTDNIDHRADIHILICVDLILINFVRRIILFFRRESERNAKQFQEICAGDGDGGCAVRRNQNYVLSGVDQVRPSLNTLAARMNQIRHGKTIAYSIHLRDIVGSARLADTRILFKVLTKVDTIGGNGVIRIRGILLEVHDGCQQVRSFPICKLIVGVERSCVLIEHLIHRVTVSRSNLHVVERPTFIRGVRHFVFVAHQTNDNCARFSQRDNLIRAERSVTVTDDEATSLRVRDSGSVMLCGHVRKGRVCDFIIPSAVIELPRFQLGNPKHELVSCDFLICHGADGRNAGILKIGNRILIPCVRSRQACRNSRNHNDCENQCKNSLEVLHSIPPNYLSNRRKRLRPSYLV